MRKEEVSLSVIRAELTKATKELHRIQRESVDIRYACYEDLLARYLNDKNPASHQESLRKARIVENTLKAEKYCQMFRKIRKSVKPFETGSGLHQINVPQFNECADIPDDSHLCLETHPAENIVWETILDPHAIEGYLLKLHFKPRHHLRADMV